MTPETSSSTTPEVSLSPEQMEQQLREDLLTFLMNGEVNTQGGPLRSAAVEAIPKFRKQYPLFREYKTGIPDPFIDILFGIWQEQHGQLQQRLSYAHQKIHEILPGVGSLQMGKRERQKLLMGSTREIVSSLIRTFGDKKVMGLSPLEIVEHALVNRSDHGSTYSNGGRRPRVGITVGPDGKS